MKRYDAVIAGMGPTGVTLANLLARRGWRVLIVDPAHEVYPLPRAITADHEAMRTFQAIGVADEVAQECIPHPGSDYLGVDGELIKTFYPAPPPHPLGWEANFLFYQPRLEARLRRELERYPYVEQRPGTSLVDAAENADSVVVVLDRDGETEEVEAEFLVGCDGARSRTRSLVQPTITDLDFDEWWVIVDTNLVADTDLPSRATQYCRPSRPGTFIIGPGSLRRWEIKVLPSEDPQDFKDDAVLRKVLSHFVDVDALEIARVAVYRFHALVVDNWRRGRILLAGDAAHQMPPFLGQGMCAGIRDAAGLAWKLDAVAKRGWPEHVLDTYEAEMRPHVAEVVGLAKSFGEIIGELDPDRAKARDIRLREARRLRPDPTRQQVIPPLSAGLIAPPPNVAAGTQFPQPRVRDASGDRVRLDEVLGDWFAVVSIENDDQSEAAPGDDSGRFFESACRALGARHVTVRASTGGENGRKASAGDAEVVDLDGTLVDWASRLGISWAIVRPDRYVYGTATSRGAALGLVEELCLQGETLASEPVVERH
ncbi:bifunctional 3-(3-hydroxy-phenyl)propionate/3-hydroxycinnamic acid hydroxylase [Streptomyces sp. NPDC002763]|uniref:bifunctional 3-(3-hydroxy-phenyl)propionate/3-hydroxycinnamic acid hydroxylase MhpA n=1 Tax=Streptomyces sp. NPDC002763 TaxID=3154427 RepID=UPI00332DE036